MDERMKTKAEGAREFSRPELSLRTRAANLDRIENETFDLAVIGGGITGAGIALDAASRGLSVALIEKRDFASGTSSRSSKLIHGGLRYLEHFEFRLVREALRERATLARLAPHLAAPLPFLVPVYSDARRSPLGSNRLKLRLGLWLYDMLAGRHNKKEIFKKEIFIVRHEWVGRDELLRLAPALDSDGLRGGFLYYDGLTDDARLVIEVIKAAAERGAAVANYAAARGLELNADSVSTIEVEDMLAGRSLRVRAKVIVNATGVWADEVIGLSDASAGRRLRPSKGIHIVVPAEKLNNRAAVLIPSLGEQRFLFVIPWQGRTVIGTTDTDYTGSLDDPGVCADEIDRVVESAARYFPEANLSTADVISAFAGLRPLAAREGASTAELSRAEEIIESRSGLLSIIGGKLTTYRRMAERVVDMVADRLNRKGELSSVHPCETERIELAGGASMKNDLKQEAVRAASEYDLAVETVEHLMRSYGGNYRVILEITRKASELKAALIEGLPHIEAEVIYAARYEMAATVEDFLARRTRIALLAREGGRPCAARVAELLGRDCLECR
ncbi:MAG: glycerol-3-phosphate dehydrogenase [Blastocatellia bacterium]|nr:glycerol-3-phosphate dehydrogenase [Blastocatellia bacterium]